MLYRLADASVPGADKVGLVEHGTAADAEALDKFGRALADSGFTPLTFEATDLVWSQSDPGNVVATIAVKAANRPSGGNFTYPMEFNPLRNTWQLTRQTADLLLQLGQTPTATPTPLSTPACGSGGWSSTCCSVTCVRSSRSAPPSGR